MRRRRFRAGDRRGRSPGHRWQAVDVDEDLAVDAGQSMRCRDEPAAALGAGALQPPLPDACPAPTTLDRGRACSRRTPVLVSLAAFVVVSLIGGWALLTRDDDQGANSVDAVASAASPDAERRCRDDRCRLGTCDSAPGVRRHRRRCSDCASRNRGNASADRGLQADRRQHRDRRRRPADPARHRASSTAGEDITIDLDHPSDSIILSYVAGGRGRSHRAVLGSPSQGAG